MKLVKDILYKIAINKVVGSTSMSIQKIAFDSRKVKKNDAFIAIKGVVSDGHQFIDKAIHQGATLIICETLPQQLQDQVTYVEVENTHSALAIMAANYYDDPSKKLQLIGVTGTNGKTTITTLLFQLFKEAGYKVGLISTVKVVIDNQVFPATHTTPDSLTLNYLLDKMVAEGVDYCFMEVSSHGIHQKRTEGLFFKGGIFTNLSHDHLDYHKNFAEYRDVKKSFFDNLPSTAFALTNVDDKNGLVMLQNTKAKKYIYALKTASDYKAQILENQFNGLLLKINNHELWVKLIGHFNAYNLLAIYGTADILKLEPLETLKIMSTLESVDGRFQYSISKNKITSIVDYAHTPDALKNVLETINTIRTGNEVLITVVGCGGDRDVSKRPKMGAIAAMLSSKVIFTSDNPRSESPEKIIEEIEAGVPGEYYNKILSITDRKQAIKTACQIANEGDIILLAGKGHETYQEINGTKIDFDDFKMINKILNNLNK